MTAPAIVFSATSQNGRRSVTVVCRDETWQAPARGLPRGHLTHLGDAGGTSAYEFIPDAQAQTWVLWEYGQSGHAPVEGAVVAVCADMQNFSSSASILVLGPVAVLKWVGYKGRSTAYTLYREGLPQTLSEGQLLALGLIQPEKIKPVEAPAPVSSAMAEALKRAGLA